MKSLEIIIPTLNRVKEVTSNVAWILSHLEDSPDNLEIIIKLSENGADDKISDDQIESLRDTAVKFGITFNFVRREERLSLGLHMNTLMHECAADWQLWCGDDDLISRSYVKFCIARCMIEEVEHVFYAPQFTTTTGEDFFSVTEQGGSELFTFNDDSKSMSLKRQKTPYYYKRGHQLSGLLIHSEFVSKCLKTMDPENLYPWITLSVEAVATDSSWLNDDVGVLVTQDTPKLFSYGKDGLVKEIYMALISSPAMKKNKKLVYYIFAHSSIWERVGKMGDSYMTRVVNLWGLRKDIPVLLVVELFLFYTFSPIYFLAIRLVKKFR